jgi:hypothetical protein
MKVNFLKDLNPDELTNFHASDLFKNISSEYSHINSYLIYNKEYFGPDYKDFSLIVYENQCFFICFYSFSNGNKLTFFNNPIRVYDLDKTNKKITYAYQTLFTKLKELKDAFQITKMAFYHNSFLLSEYFDVIDFHEIELIPYIDLTQSFEEIRMNVRKSYKSLINWGIKNLSIIMIDQKNPDKDKFDSFKNFHIKVAGRQTRSDLTWELQYTAILQNEAFLVLGYLDNKLVSGSYILYGREQAYYGVAVHDRQLMAKNLSIGHAVLINAIEKAKELGLKEFCFGDVNIKGIDKKVDNIAKYKRGFTNTCRTGIGFTVTI